MLCKIVTKGGKDWDELLGPILLVHRTVLHSFTGKISMVKTLGFLPVQMEEKMRNFPTYDSRDCYNKSEKALLTLTMMFSKSIGWLKVGIKFVRQVMISLVSSLETISTLFVNTIDFFVRASTSKIN